MILPGDAAGGLPLAAEMRHAFSGEGILAGSQDFEYRPEQQEMAEAVARALERERSLVVEAGTGVGKSLAYLLPAMSYGLDAGRKAVFSTHTINLQEQLLLHAKQKGACRRPFPLQEQPLTDSQLAGATQTWLCPAASL